LLSEDVQSSSAAAITVVVPPLDWAGTNTSKLAADNLVAITQASAAALRTHGVRGLYTGFTSSLLGEAIGTGLGFMAYETGNAAFFRKHGRKPSAAEKGAIGAASALVVMTATMPLECIQRRMQARPSSAHPALYSCA
jgi:Mitochondrial carrier protein